MRKRRPRREEREKEKDREKNKKKEERKRGIQKGLRYPFSRNANERTSEVRTRLGKRKEVFSSLGEQLRPSPFSSLTTGRGQEPRGGGMRDVR